MNTPEFFRSVLQKLFISTIQKSLTSCKSVKSYFIKLENIKSLIVNTVIQNGTEKRRMQRNSNIKQQRNIFSTARDVISRTFTGVRWERVDIEHLIHRAVARKSARANVGTNITSTKLKLKYITLALGFAA